MSSRKRRKHAGKGGSGGRGHAFPSKSVPYVPGWGMNWEAHGGSTHPRDPADLVSLGIQLARHPFKWSTIEPAVEGTFVWTLPDAFVAEAVANDIQLVGVLSSRPAWTGAGDPLSVPPDPTKYYNYASAVVTRYKGMVRNWQIWNEPNENAWTEAEYKTIVTGAYPILKAIDPSNKIMMNVSKCPVKASGAKVAFTETLMTDPDFRAATDVVTFHTYFRPFSPEVGNATNGAQPAAIRNTMEWLRDTCNWHGEVWTTEGGYPTEDAGTGRVVSETDQALFNIRLGLINRMNGINQHYWYRAYSKDGPPWNIDGDSEGVIRGDGTHKPSRNSIAVLARIIDTSVTSITEYLSGPVWGCRYTKPNGRYGYVLWADAETLTYTLKGMTKRVRQTSMFGTVTIHDTPRGELTVQVTSAPAYYEIMTWED